VIEHEDDQRPCEACDGTGLAVIEERRGLELHDRCIPCPTCSDPDIFATDEHERAEPPPYDRDPDVLREHLAASVTHSRPRWLGGTCTRIGSEYDVDYAIEQRKGAA
jgi:hypothetical protein